MAGVHASAAASSPPARGLAARWWRWAAGPVSLPPPRQLAAAAVLGAVAVAITNAIAIAAVVPWPLGGLGLRLLHHGFDLLEVVGLGALWGLIAAALTGGVGRRSWVGWLLLAVLTTAAMRWALGQHLMRQAVGVLGGRLSGVLYPTYVLLCGLAIPVAHGVGAAAATGRWSRWLALLSGLGGMVVAHAILRDDYPGVHAALLWTSACLFGSALAPRWVDRLMPRHRLPTALSLHALVAALAIAVPPPNAVRIELFREPGAVAAWLLARTVWTAPALKGPVPTPAVYESSPPSHRPLRRGYAQRPVVVLVTVEALRADVLSDPEHAAELPTFRRLRDNGAYFPRAVAGGSQTSVTLSTMFSGRYFSQLRWAPFGEGKKRFLYAADDPTIRYPELLTAAGVHTHSVLGLIFLGEDNGIARGFGTQTMVVDNRRHAPANELMRPLLKRLGRLGRIGQQRYFGYTHLTEPHEPYDRGKLKEGSDWQRYLSEVAVVDRWLARLLRVMKQRFRRRGYLIITGDHGEAFGEHGTHFHTKTLYEELVRVPLIIWGPGIRAHHHTETAALIDLGPTIMQLFGEPTPAGAMGQSLLPLIDGEVESLERPVFAEGRLRHALFTRDHLKVIEDTRRKTVEVYDLDADPGETENLFDVDPARATPAVAELRAFFARHTLREGGYRPPYKR